MEDIVEDISEFIVESIDISDDTWKFSDIIRELSDKEIQLINSGLGIPKMFTSLATNATIFRWRLGDTIENPTIETTSNPYIHIYQTSGTYSVSHQSCYPCPSTGTLLCSNGWCTKSLAIGVIPINITSNTYACFYPCLTIITVTWQNLDNVEYIFRPSITIDGSNTISYTSDVTIPAISTIDVSITIPGSSLPVGNHTICPNLP